MLHFLLKHSPLPLVSRNKVGFRLSLIDSLVIVIALLITYFYPKHFLDIALFNNFFHYSVLFVVANFFLFCNVFRIRTRFELIWIGLSAINVLVYLIYYQNSYVFLILQFLFTSFSVFLEMRTPEYHGILTKHIQSWRQRYK
jgi:hypothetical protein